MARRGRPPKFGRRAQLLAVTLPEDVVDYLQAGDSDPAWSIVRLVEHARGRQTTTNTADRAVPEMQLMPIGRKRLLIVVRVDTFPVVDGASLIPIGAGRAFLAFAPGRTLHALELSTLDALERPGLTDPERVRLMSLREQLKAWRLDPSLTFAEHSIVVGERQPRRAKSRSSSRGER